MPNGKDEREVRLYPWGREPVTPTTPFPTGPYMRYPQTREEMMGEERSDPSKMPAIAPPQGMKWEWLEWSPEGQYTGGQWELVSTEEWPIEPMTEYQEEQMRLQREELEWRMRQAAETGDMTAYQQAQLEIQRLEAERGLVAERARLAGLGDWGWIERWYAGNLAQRQRQQWQAPQRAGGQMPRGPTERWEELDWTPEQYEAGRQRLAKAREIGDTTPDITLNIPAESRYVYGYADTLEQARKQEEALDIIRELGGTYQRGHLTPPEETMTPTKFAGQVGQILEERVPSIVPGEEYGIEQVAYKTPKAKSRKEKGKIKLPTTPSTPPFPWLAQVTPGLGARLGDWTGKTKVPSGQLWQTIPASERARFGAMINWRRGTGTEYQGYQDILDRMAMMQPVKPEQRPKWRPARSR